MSNTDFDKAKVVADGVLSRACAFMVAHPKSALVIFAVVLVAALVLFR